jgi:hypothetical protein
MEMDGKEYFVTKPELARKMIEKIPDSEWKKAENILTVNSKVGEWIIEIYKKYGKDVANRVKIVPAGEKTKLFIKKTLNILGLDEYNILDIKDKNGNGTYDVRDFLDLDNEKIIELADMPKGSRFSCCIMNPPYGSDKSGDRYLHFKFVEKCLNISHKTVDIMPFRMITSSNKIYDTYKNDYNNSIISIEEVPSSLFNDTHMDRVAIYNFDDNKIQNSEIIVTYKDGNKQITNNLLDISVFNDYEKDIVKYLYNEGKPNYTDLKVRDVDIKRNKQKLTNFINTFLVPRLHKDYYFLLTNLANGGMNGKWISGNAGGIYKLNELIQYALDTNAAVKNIMQFKTLKEAENCKVALENNVLRWVLYRVQDDQGMTGRVYKYIPNIDWEDDRVKTDEGLLEVCGCPKDKCKEYADYCKKVIEEVDKK